MNEINLREVKELTIKYFNSGDLTGILTLIVELSVRCNDRRERIKELEYKIVMLENKDGVPF